jgi:ABC-2 type transport system ATP-binding protein
MIVVNRLTQLYRGGRGVFDLDFAVPAGEVFGYLGPKAPAKRAPSGAFSAS